MEKSSKLNKVCIGGFFLVLLSIYFYFGFQHIGKFETADESLWISSDTSANPDRINAYWNAIGSRHWLGTRINDKPGITLAYVSGIGLFFDKKTIGNTQHDVDFYRQSDAEKFEVAIVYYRLPILIFNGLLSILFYFFIVKLTKNRWLGIATVTLILLSPILMGISQIINPDSLLFSLAFATLLSFILFLQNRKIGYAVLTSLFLGLSLLSKYTATIFFLFFFILAFVHLFLYYEYWEDKVRLRNYVQKIFIAIPMIIGGSLLLFSLLMPASFIQPDYLLKMTIFLEGMGKYLLIIIGLTSLLILDVYRNQGGYIQKIILKSKPYKNYLLNLMYLLLGLLFLLSFLNWSIFNNILHIKQVAFDLARDYQFQRQHFIDKLFLELLPLAFTVSPIVLLATLFLWIKSSIFKKSRHDFAVFALSLFIMMFYAALIKIKLLTHVRYEIMLYPIMAFLAAIGIWEIVLLLKAKRKLLTMKILALIAVLFVGVADLVYIQPFYFNYTSVLLPKDMSVVGAWGYGGYEAAQYLNKLPDAKNLLVWSDYEGFCNFFVGRCMEKNDWKLKITNDDFKNIQVDYIISTRRGHIVSDANWSWIEKNLKLEKEPVWELLIDDRPRNYVRILKFSNYEKE